MNIDLLTQHQLEFLSLKGGFTGSSESVHVKMPHCWKSHVTAQMLKLCIFVDFQVKCMIVLISDEKWDLYVLFYSIL